MADSAQDKYSLNRNLQRDPLQENCSEFELWSDRFKRIYPSYQLEKDSFKIMPTQDTTTLNLKELK